MIYFTIAASIIAADAILKEYFKSTFRGKHRKANRKDTNRCVNKEDGLLQKKSGRIKQWKRMLRPEIEILENRGAASGILSSHPKVIKGISAGMLCFCVLALGREKQRGKVTAAGIGYALLLGGGLSNFIDRVRKGSVTDYIRFPKVPVKKISELVFNLSDFGIFAGVFCLLFRKK